MSEYDNYAKKSTDGKLNTLFKKIIEVDRELKELKLLFQFKTPTAAPETHDEVPIDIGPPIKDDLIADGVDFGLVDYEAGGLVIRPTKFLGDLWSGLDQKLTAWNYLWVREGRDSRWRFHPKKDAKPETAPPKTGGAAIPVLEVGTYVTIEGNLVEDPIQRDVDTPSGPASVTSFRVKLDDEQTVKISLWDEKGEKAMDLVNGDRLHLTNMKVKDPYEGMPQLSSAKYTKVSKVPNR